MTDNETAPPASEEVKLPPVKKSKKAAPAKKAAKAGKKIPSRNAKRTPASAKPATPKVRRAFPVNTLEEARRLADAIKQFNMGNPWAPSEVAKAIGLGKH